MTEMYREAERLANEPDNQAEALTYGLKLIAEAIQAHFGECNDDYDEDVDDTSNHDAWEAFDALSRAALPEAPAVPVVKALEWADYSDEDGFHLEARTVVGTYSVRGAHLEINGCFAKTYITSDAAKAAAQADFEARIRSALQSSPPVQDLMDSDYARDIMHIVPTPVKAAAVDGEVSAKAILRQLMDQFETFDKAPENAVVWVGGWSNPEAATHIKTVRVGDIRAALASQNAVEGEAVAWAKREHLEMGRHQFSTVRHPTPGFDVPLYARPAAADALVVAHGLHEKFGAQCGLNEVDMWEPIARAALSLAAKREQTR
jgi:hypothetical protein